MSETVIQQKNPILNSLLLYPCKSYSKIEDNLILFYFIYDVLWVTEKCDFSQTN